MFKFIAEINNQMKMVEAIKNYDRDAFDSLMQSEHTSAKDKNTAKLFWSIAHDDEINSIEFLLEKAYQVPEQDGYIFKANNNKLFSIWRTALKLAIDKHRPDVVKIILEYEDIDSTTFYPIFERIVFLKDDALNLAVRSHQIKVVELLLNHRKINIRDNLSSKANAVNLAFKDNLVDIMELLLEHIAKRELFNTQWGFWTIEYCNFDNSWWDQALKQAFEYNSISNDMIELLIDYDTYLKINWESAFSLANNHGRTDISKLIEKNGKLASYVEHCNSMFFSYSGTITGNRIPQYVEESPGKDLHTENHSPITPPSLI